MTKTHFFFSLMTVTVLSFFVSCFFPASRRGMAAYLGESICERVTAGSILALFIRTRGLRRQRTMECPARLAAE